MNRSGNLEIWWRDPELAARAGRFAVLLALFVGTQPLAAAVFTTDTTIDEADTTYDGDDVIVSNATVTINGPHAFNSLFLTNNAVLTHSPCTTTNTHKLDLRVVNEIVVSADCRIDVSGKGYLAGYTTGNTTNGGAFHLAGGSYGGLGGGSRWYQDGSRSNAVYGDYANPNDWGSGAGRVASGGGLVTLVAQRLQLEGEILANGAAADPTCYPVALGGGAGGAVLVVVTNLTGRGSIRAWGGNACPGSGSGGGGRIAVYASDYSGFDLTNITTLSGVWPQVEDPLTGAGAGTVYLRDSDEAQGTLVIDARDTGLGWTPLGMSGTNRTTFSDFVLVRGGHTHVQALSSNAVLDFATNLTVSAGAQLKLVGSNSVLRAPLTVNGGTVDVSGALDLAGPLILVDGGRLTVTALNSPLPITVSDATLVAELLSVPDLVLTNNAVLTHPACTANETHRLEIKAAGTITVSADSRIDVNAKGYLPGYTTGNTTDSAAVQGAGGSYGGLGHPAAQASGVYGDYGDPNDLGSGSAASKFGAPGGGLVRVAAQRLQLDGQILANGGQQCSGGAGGGVLVAVTSLRGLGSIQASGGNSCGCCGSGGGGRVAVYASDYSGFNLANLTALGGKGVEIDFYPAGQAGAGTVYIRNTHEAQGTLLIDARTGGVGPTPLGTILSDVVVVSGATLVGEYLSVPELRLTNNAVLTHVPCTATETHRLDINVAGLLTVSTNSRIDVSGKGYLGGRTSGNTTNGASTRTSGGSYGGLGGGLESGAGVPNAVYGDYADPEDWGSGGGDIQFPPPSVASSGEGGGLVRIAANAFQLGGMVLADGRYGTGAGSGGGIWVSVQTLLGTGTIRAAGGFGVGFSNIGPAGGGGGGRVAIYALDFSGFPLANVSAPGGGADGGAPYYGRAGTVHIVQGVPHTHVRSLNAAGRNGAYLSNAFDKATLTFNKTINTNSFDGAKFSITGPLGPVDFSGPVEVADRAYQLSFPLQTANGPYRFTLLPTLLDNEGFPLDQNANGIPGEPSDAYSFTLVLDTVAPRVMQHAPAGDLTGPVSHIDIWFSEPIDQRTLTLADVAVFNPLGESVPAGNIQQVGLDRFRVSFAAQTIPGQYVFDIGPDIQDQAGNSLDQNQNGIFGEATDDVYEGAFNLTEVDLALSNLTVSTNQLWAGDTLSFAWKGSNRSGAPLLGDWTDAVYISADDKWDINDILLDVVPHSGGLAANEVYSASANVRVPALLPGNYYILVRSDILNEEGSGSPNGVIASGPIPLNVRAFPSAGGSFANRLTPDARSACYAINLPAGQSLLLKLAVQSTNVAVSLYVRAGAIPTTLEYDQRAFGSGLNLQVALSNSSTNDQTYYVLVHGDLIDDPLLFNLSTQAGPLFLTSVTPARHGNAASATLTLTGAGFDNTTTVDFVSTNGAVFSSDGMEVVSPTTLRLNVNLTNWSAGQYTVRAVKGAATSELAEALEVLSGGAAHLSTRLLVPSVLGFNIPIRQTIWIEYRNEGEISMPAPLLVVQGDLGARLTADTALAIPRRGFGEIPGVSNTTQVLGVGSSSTPSILQPGEAERRPVYYLGLSEPTSSGQVAFTLSTATATARLVESLEPNAKFGPAGFGASAFVSGHDSLPYQVRFENKAEATGPVRRVVVNDTLDSSLDLSTLELTEIAFANHFLSIPSGLNHYEARVPMTITNVTGTHNIVVDVQAALDAAARILTLTLTALDPDTGWLPSDPLIGLLYPDDDTGLGVGTLSYLIKPRTGLLTGMHVENRASVAFDYNDPVDTPIVFNTIDATPPASSMTPLAEFSARDFLVQWSATDDATGIVSYDVYVSDNGSNYLAWMAGATNTSAIFNGIPGHTYAFYTIAHDNVGNARPSPAAPDTQTTVFITGVPLVLSASLSPMNEFSFTFTSRVGVAYAVEVSSNLANWQTVTNFIGSGAAIQFTDCGTTNAAEGYYRVSTP